MIGRYDGRIARTFKAGWLMLKWVCLLVMFGFATAFMVGYLGYLDSVPFGIVIGGFVWSCIGLVIAYVFEQSRSSRAILRFTTTRLMAVLILATGAAFLVGII